MMNFKHILMALIISAVTVSSCSELPPRKYEITQYSMDGSVLGKWHTSDRPRTGNGWIVFRTEGNRRIRINGPYKMEEIIHTH